MIYGNATRHAKPDAAQLERRWCPQCREWVTQHPVDESYGDHFGRVTDWDVQDICPLCEGPTVCDDESETEGSDMVEQPQEQRCNACMAVFGEGETACPECGRDDALMFPFEGNAAGQRPIWEQSEEALDYFEKSLREQLCELQTWLAEATQVRDEMRAWLADHPPNGKDDRT